jgi:hypothetical protein
MANAGERRGVEVLAKAIRLKAGDPAIELYELGLALHSAAEQEGARAALVEIARGHAICRRAKDVGRLMAMIDLRDGTSVSSLLSDLRHAGGESQAHEFQLVGTHLQAVAGYSRSKPQEVQLQGKSTTEIDPMKDERLDFERRLDEITAGLDPDNPEDRIKFMHAHMAEIIRRAGSRDLAEQTEKMVGLPGTKIKQRSSRRWWQFWK